MAETARPPIDGGTDLITGAGPRAVAPPGRPTRHTAPQRSQSAEPAGKTSTDMRISRLVLSGAAIGTIIGAGLADLRLDMFWMVVEVTRGAKAHIQVRVHSA